MNNMKVSGYKRLLRFFNPVSSMVGMCPRIERCVLIAALCVSCCAMSGCLESSFQLARESRLPKWITVPPELTRADVSVTMNYYTLPRAKFILKDMKGKKLATVSGNTKHLYSLKQGKFYYPAYELITVNGITDIIEHRKMEPIFYVTDDPAVWKDASGVRNPNP